METMLEGKKSTHIVEVVPVVLEKHPDADRLSVVQVYGYQCVTNTEQWKGITKAGYICPDSVVDTKRPEFAFLANKANAEGKYRVKAAKIRGTTSYGLLFPVAEHFALGDDVSDYYEIKRYEPGQLSRSQKDKFVIGGEEESAPNIDTGPEKYDVESFERYAFKLLEEGEPIFITEKLDGMNCRFVWHDGRYYVKSRNRWVKRVPDYSKVTVEFLTAQGVEVEKATDIVNRLYDKEKSVNSLWQQLEKTEPLMKYLRDNSGVTVFGEIYGNTNRLKYGFKEGNRFAAFDIYKDGGFLSTQEYVDTIMTNTLPYAPVLYPCLDYSFAVVKTLAKGTTVVQDSNVIREGVVVRPVKERYQHRFGRVILKSVNPAFLERDFAEPTEAEAVFE